MLSDDIRIRLLGPIELADAGDLRGGDLGGPKQRLLLACLALRPGRTLPTEDLIEVLWPDQMPEDAHRSLQVHVSKLRRVLVTAGIEATIEHRGRGYALLTELSAIDATCFEQLVEQGVALVERDPTQARETLRQALALWRGRPLVDVDAHDSLRGETARLEALHLRAVEARIAADLATGHHAEVVVELRRLTDEHPLEEPLWGHLMVALYRCGRQGEALQAFARAREVLSQELGADPSRSLQGLHRRILTQDRSLDRPTGRADDAAALDVRAVAVLPFEVIGDSDEAALLASGLHNDLLTELSRNPQLTVISRSSVIGYGPNDRTASTIARELEVGTIVQGAVQGAGLRVRLTIQLVDGARGTYRWAQSYDDELTTQNLFAIQADLARDIAASLSAELAGPPRGAEQAGPPTASLDAYRLVAAGRQQFDLKTAEGFARAVECYDEAVRLDPDYGNAWVGLADALVSMDAYGHGRRHELLPRAEKAVHRALSLNPDSAEARTSLGVLHTGHQEGPAALMEFRRAFGARPNYADAHNWHSWVSLLTGDAPSGLDSARRAAELDPRNAEAHAHVALGLAANGDPVGALEAVRVARRLSPYTTGQLYEGLCLYELGRPEDARRVLEPLVPAEAAPTVPWAPHGPHALLALTLVELGEHTAAQDVAARIDPLVSPFAAAIAALGLGEADRAAQSFARVDRLTAWPCLLVHHYHDRIWSRGDATGHHDRMTGVALRSWNVHAPPG
jgi:DNA-binding SARP family transcriptional activator/Tfp pilus assembly protein PilF